MYSNRKSFILKLLVGICGVYVCIHVFTHTATPVIREMQESGRNLAALGSGNLDNPVVDDENFKEALPMVDPTKNELMQIKNVDKIMPTETALSPLDKVRQVTQCTDKPLVPKIQQRGDYWVLYNYVPAEKKHRCHESITYTTHADFSFMDNLVPLLERWKGPISIALHAPGSDFQNTIDSIAYLRDCTSPLVKELVTFHIYFSTKHVPKEVPKQDNIFVDTYNCSLTPPFMNVSSETMYKAQKKLLYPVNVGRNVARETSQTHFILPSDIELYPSPSIIEKFLTMIGENAGPLSSKVPKVLRAATSFGETPSSGLQYIVSKGSYRIRPPIQVASYNDVELDHEVPVFPLHIFEVSANQQVPDNKTMLKEMLANGTAIPFHKKLCPGCHTVPKAKEWQTAKETVGLHVFHVGKRNGRFIHWEPIFIGTHADPLYDERLSWEGKMDKMTQGYALCVMDYNFMILDNAFLVHKPGIKIYKKDPRRAMLAGKTHQLISKIIYPELKVIYGTRKGCAV